MSRSTRAAAAVARLNRRAEGETYQMVVTGTGLFKLCRVVDGQSAELGEALDQDAFVRFVDAQGAQVTRRNSKYDAAFATQLDMKT